jgi:glycerate dehydrogenase
MRGVFLDDLTVTAGDLDLTALRDTLTVWRFAGMTAASDIGESVRDADVVITNKVILDRATLSAAPRLRLVCVAATGTDNVDLQAAIDHDISVCNVRGYAMASVVEHVFMVMLALGHRLHDHRTAVQRGDWNRSPVFSLLDYPITELAGRTLGIIGYGDLGKAVARVAGAFGMNILIAQRPGGPEQPGRCPLELLLTESDIVTLHCPLTGTTRNLIGAPELKLMRNHALLINTARGGIVDEHALREALQNGDIAGAAIDVLGQEPPRVGNPLLDGNLPNLIITPHIAWAGIHSRQALIGELTENIRAFLSGSPRNIVTP